MPIKSFKCPLRGQDDNLHPRQQKVRRAADAPMPAKHAAVDSIYFIAPPFLRLQSLLLRAFKSLSQSGKHHLFQFFFNQLNSDKIAKRAFFSLCDQRT